MSMSWGGGSIGSSPFLHQTCLQALTLAEGPRGAQTRSLPFSQHQLLKKRLQPPLGCVEAAEAPWLCLDFSVGPAVPHPPRFAVPSPGAGWGWEPWQQTLANGGMAERRSKKMCWRNESALTSQPACAHPHFALSQEESIGSEKWEEGFPSTPSRNHPPSAPSCFGTFPALLPERNLLKQKGSFGAESHKGQDCHGAPDAAQFLRSPESRTLPVPQISPAVNTGLTLAPCDVPSEEGSKASRDGELGVSSSVFLSLTLEIGSSRHYESLMVVKAILKGAKKKKKKAKLKQLLQRHNHPLPERCHKS